MNVQAWKAHSVINIGPPSILCSWSTRKEIVEIPSCSLNGFNKVNCEGDSLVSISPMEP